VGPPEPLIALLDHELAVLVSLGDSREPLGVFAKACPAVCHGAQAFGGREQTHELAWVLACRDERRQRPDPVLLKKRHLVVTDPGVQVVESPRAGLDDAQVIQIQMALRGKAAWGLLRRNGGAFEPGEAIPQRYTCEGDDISPPLEWAGLPAGAKSLDVLPVS
jgi:hypothetical protein